MKPRPTTTEDNALPSSSNSPLVSTSQRVQGSSTSTIAPPNLDHALVRTTRALQSGQPSLRQLQSECEDLLKSNIDDLKGDLILKINSIFSAEEIFSRIVAFHGQGRVKISSVNSRIAQAKATLVSSRGVESKDISREIKENRQRSGAYKRAMDVRAERLRETARRMSAAGDGDEDLEAPLTRNESRESVQEETKGRGSFVDVAISPIRRAEGDEDGSILERNGGNMNGGVRPQPTDVEPQRSEAGLKASEIRPQAPEDQPRAPEFRTRAGNTQPKRFASAGDGNDTTKPVPIPPRPTSPLIPHLPPGAPFDPTPYGQPYAGTHLYVPGWREDGSIGWREYLKKHPEYMYPRSFQAGTGGGGSSTGRDDGADGAQGD